MIPITMSNGTEDAEKWISAGMKVFWSLAAGAMTALLFLLMAYLITPQSGIPEKTEGDVSIEITRQAREERSEEKDRPEAKKPVQQKTPPPPPMPRNKPRTLADNGALMVNIPDFGDGNRFAANADRRATPIVRIPPQYPQTALIKGIEGWVLVEFTITAGGTVADARVIDSQPKAVFDRETLRAIRRWKYQPKVVDGQAVPQYNMRELVQFVLEDPER